MDNLNKVLGSLLVVALVYIVFLQGCGGKREIKTEVITIKRVDSSTYVDTVKFPVKEFEYVKVRIPIPYYDTIRIVMPSGNYFEDFDERESDCDFMLKYASIYEDTIKNDTISLYYRAKVRGYLDELKIGYKIFTPYYIKSITTIETEIVKRKAFNGIYLGMDVGIGKDGLTHLAPMLEVSTAKINYNGGFDFNDKSVMVGLRFKLGK